MILLPPAFAEDLIVLNDNIYTELAEEGRWNKSTRLIEETLLHYDDLKEIVSYPYDHSEEAWYYLAGIGGLILLDEPITRFYQDRVEPIFEGGKLPWPKWAKAWPDRAAEGYITLGLTSSYLAGIALNDEKLQQAALLAGKASVYSILISHIVLKSLIARKRPLSSLSAGEDEGRDYTNNPYAFGYYHRPDLGTLQYGTAMPSFHVTDFFAVARVYQQVYDNYLIPYSLLAIAFTSNITAHRHWVSDMVAGAVIGTVIGSAVVDGVVQEDSPATMILPVITNEEVGVSLTYQF